ncbi:hypothetical protein [Streptomyces sp. KLOTTS4A1]|uniref:hypothetical protein n=1 Tax=Streptomyces sp. KLOTTS4A1 TaxID=3390996 RepID=UPI0039F53032
MLLSLLAVMALGASTTAMATPAQPETPQAQEQPGRKVGRIDLADLKDVPAPTLSRSLPAASGESCEPTRPGSRERRAGAVEACVTVTPSPVTPNGRRGEQAGRAKQTEPAGRTTAATAQPTASATTAATATATADDASCTITTPGTWQFSRFQYCVSGLTVLYVLRDGNGKQIGTGTLSVAQSAMLPAAITNPKWNEYVTVTMTGATGAVTSLTAKFRSACTTGCKASKNSPWWGGQLVKGESVNGFVTYESKPGPGAKLEFTTSYKLYVTAPGAVITDPSASWSNPEQIRCDDDVRDTASTTHTDKRGCVVPSVTPVVKLGATTSSGNAAAGYLWAQENLADGWGRDKPLTRAKSGIADRTSRTCGGFGPRTDLVADDSCGAFPFSATHEGGIDGAQCAELVPNYSSGGWDIYKLNGEDTSRPCAQVHAPRASVDGADTQLTEGFKSQRVVEAEEFEVRIAAATPEPQAACLDNLPAGSMKSGNGWYLNTTEKVDHVNKTTTPPGPSGTRASTATACIGKNIVKGTDAEGDITGLEDARIYRATTPYTSSVIARCHLIANKVGGKGRPGDGGPDNLVPCWQVGMNTGTPSMRTYESAAQTAVGNDAFGPNDAILYVVVPDYKDATSTIPQGVTMSATVQRADGTSQPLFPEVYIPNTKGNTGKYNLGN